MRALAAWTVLAALLAAPVAAAQDHAHMAAMPHVVFDGRTSGHAVVGEVTHLGYVLLDEGRAPVPHQDAVFRLVQDDVVLFETVSAHEYDGIFSYDHVFAAPGPYRVEVEWEDMVANFSGVVVLPKATVEGATLDVKAPTEAAAGVPVAFDLAVLDGAGAIVPHSDVIVEAWRAADLVLRTHLHTHEERMAFDFAFPSAGSYEMRFTGYIAFPGPDSVDLRAFTTTHEVAVSAVGAALPTPSGLCEASGGPTSVRRAVSSGSIEVAPRFFTSVDPQAANGPLTLARFNGLVVAEEPGVSATEQHVNFVARLTGPRGVVFASETLHEYDGHFELAVRPEVPGSYTLEIEAEDVGKGLQEMCVLPPLIPLGVGPYTAGLADADDVVAGVPVELAITLDGARDRLAHSEVLLVVVRAADGVAVLDTKLHGHAGAMTATVTFPEAGDYEVRLVGFPLMGEPVTVTNAVFGVTVAAGAAVAGVVPGAVTGAQGVPGLGALALLASVAALALARRR